MQCFLVSHTHWDREWYRTFQGFRARLVDTIDRVLDLVAADPGFRFLLDGQTIVVEDYAEVRPGRIDALREACRARRIAIGPWYVQPDSLLPSGESHIRNLLEGRRVAEEFGGTSHVAYVPDSFGHPAQLPQLFAGFGLAPFIYWRGNGDEIDELPSEYLWRAPDGSTVLAHHLWRGYFSAAGLPCDPSAAAEWLRKLGTELAARSRSECVLLMSGIDHAPPDENTAAVAEALAKLSGWTVHRALLDDFAATLPVEAPVFEGELLGGRIAPLLPGVWSARIPLKLRNRRVESLLLGWAEPWASLGHHLTGTDERASLRSAWRALLANQAHDSICGCSIDRVHEQMGWRYDHAEELARETTRRVLERLAGLGFNRSTPWSGDLDVAVFNPSPHPRTDLVRLALEPSTWFEMRSDGSEPSLSIHPLLAAALSTPGFTVNGQPARVVEDHGAHRVRLFPQHPPRSIEFVVQNVPAFGWKRFALRASAAHLDRQDDEPQISLDGRVVRALSDGTFSVDFAGREYRGLCSVEDVGDRGDTYDFDPVGEDDSRLEGVTIRRTIAANSVQALTVTRDISVPARLRADRRERDAERAIITVETEACLVPGVERLGLRVRLHNRAQDHRLRLLFPTGAPVDEFCAATTFDVRRRSMGRPDSSRWVHPAPATFPHHGFVTVNGLTIGAPGLPEAEVRPDGTVAITLVRSVGWLSRLDLRSRPQPAGPTIPTPGAQCLQSIEARLVLLSGLHPEAVRDAELGLEAVFAGTVPLLPPERSLLKIEPQEILLSTVKPAESGAGVIIRVLNPTERSIDARFQIGFPFTAVKAVRLDETGCSEVSVRGTNVLLAVPAHALRSVLIA
jgi:mannosylglycerate hydrolase